MSILIKGMEMPKDDEVLCINIHPDGKVCLYYDLFCTKIAEAVEFPPRWIPVTERLPEKDCHVLAYYGFDRGDGDLGMMFMQVLDYWAHDRQPHFRWEGEYGMTVTHWMQLPEPPKEEV